ncbi:MAG: hypothetical protein ABSG05_00240 [Candidatus Pacearchaeota archaeon]|jgi:hypothetical protein
MELLVKRDPNTLSTTDGKVIGDDLPKFLRTPRVVPQGQVENLNGRNPNDDLLIVDESDFKEIEEHFKSGGQEVEYQGVSKPQKEIKQKLDSIVRMVSQFPGMNTYTPRFFPGLWSGYRSALVQDPETKKWYKLKGVSVDPENPVAQDMGDGHFRIVGGQEGFSAQFEKLMSNKFNQVLQSVGIEPAMSVRGFWKYPVLVRNVRPTATITEIKGDTRLDELMIILDGLATHKFYMGRKTRDGKGNSAIEIGEFTKQGEEYIKTLGKFYYDIGFVVGRLKRLMDRNVQTWSSNFEQTNAHIGNIVLYNGSDKVKVGLVDFDASCDTRDYSRSEIRDLQERERRNILESALHGPISPRQIQGKPFLGREHIMVQETRKRFIDGFNTGYESSNRN